MSEMFEENQETIKNSEEITKISYLKLDGFINRLLKNPVVSSLWGEFGTGKTTFALQLAKKVLNFDNLKVFYLLTKQSPITNLINRLLHNLNEKKKANLLIWQAETFNQQYSIVLDWQIQIKQLKEFFKKEQVGLLIIDEIASKYLKSLGSDEKNEKLNKELTLILATLANIVKTHKIPLLLLNTFSIKKIEKSKEKTYKGNNKEKTNKEITRENKEKITENKEDYIIEENNDKIEVYKAIPHGGKIIDYWTEFEWKTERTPQVSKVLFTVIKKNKKLGNIPKKWTWTLSKNGFI